MADQRSTKRQGRARTQCHFRVQMEEYVAREKKERPWVAGFCLMTTLCWGITWTLCIIQKAHLTTFCSTLNTPAPNPPHVLPYCNCPLLQTYYIFSICICCLLQLKLVPALFVGLGKPCSLDKSIHYFWGKSFMNPALGHAHSQPFQSIWFFPLECSSSIHAFHSIVPGAAPGSLWSSL